jgi:biopolymer transport protein ExbD
MAMTLNGGREDAIVDMNTTPLIDVMLVLLTLLIITLPMQTNAVKIDMPHGVPPQTVKPEVVALNVEFDGTITWNGATVNRAQLDANLARAAAQPVQPEVHLQADRLAKYDTVAKVLSDTQRFGLRRIGFADTQRYENP